MNDGLSMAIGFVLGAATVLVTGLAAFRLAARFYRTGSADPLPKADDALHGAIPVNPEVSAHRRIMEDAREKGADELQALARAQGEHLSREDALHQAERMLRGENPMGGVV